MNYRISVSIIILLGILIVPACLLAADDSVPSPPAVPPDETTTSTNGNTNTNQTELKNKIENAQQVKGRVSEYCGYLPGRLKAVADAKKMTANVESQVKEIETICGALETFDPAAISDNNVYLEKSKEYKVNFGKLVKATDSAIARLNGE